MRSHEGPSDLEGSPQADTEKELAEAFKRGEPGAYEAIYVRFQPKVHGVTKRMLADPHDAEEAAQEAFLKVYQALPRFNGRYQLGAWIARITTNVCLDQLRSRTRKPSIPSTLEELDLELSERYVDESPENLALRSADSRYVRKVLADLPPMHRAAIILRDFEGLSYEEVARALDISPVQCKALIHRARQNFKRSWVPASVAGLLPWRLMDRLRGEGRRFGHEAGQASRSVNNLTDVAAHASQAASSCTVVLQQCGAALTERVAGVAAATVIAVGSFAVGAEVARSNSEPVQEAVTVTLAEKPAVKTRMPLKTRKVRTSDEKVPVAAPDDQPSPPEQSQPTAAPSPSPAATPGTSTGGSGGSGGQEPPPSPKPSPTVQAFSAAIGWDSGSGIPAATPTSRSESVDCGAKAVTQLLEIPIWDGTAFQPGRVRLQTAPSIQVQIEITKDGQSYTYNGGAHSLGVSSRDDKMFLSFSGSYSHVGENPESANLPKYGQFSAELQLDCTAQRVITESIKL